MAVVYAADVKDSRMLAVRDQIDAAPTPGRIQIGTANMATVLADFQLNDPSGTVSSGVLTLSGFPKTDSSADNSGTAAAARIRDGDGNDVITGLTVGTSGTDVILDSVSITQSQQVTLNSATITHA